MTDAFRMQATWMFLLAAATLAHGAWLCAARHIAVGDHCAVVIAAVPAYITGGMAQKATGNGKDGRPQ